MKTAKKTETKFTDKTNNALKEESKMRKILFIVISVLMLVGSFTSASHAVSFAYVDTNRTSTYLSSWISVLNSTLPDFNMTHLRACWTGSGDLGYLDIWADIKNIGGNSGLDGNSLPVWIVIRDGKPYEYRDSHDGYANSPMPYAFQTKTAYRRYVFDYKSITGFPTSLQVVANVNAFNMTKPYAELSETNNQLSTHFENKKSYNISGRIYYQCWDVWQ